MGYNPLHAPNFIEIVDTADLYRKWTRSANPTKLAAILYHFDIVAWNLHNAGNDAFYTMRAMLAICVTEARDRESAEAKRRRDEESKAQIQERVSETAQAALSELAAWDSGEEITDGGSPLCPADR